MKKKKIARIVNAIAAEPKAEKSPMRTPLVVEPVEPDELPPDATTRPLTISDESDLSTYCKFASICCRDKGDGVCIDGTVDEVNPSGDVVGLPIIVLSVDGRPASAPGPDASWPCMVH